MDPAHLAAARQAAVEAKRLIRAYINAEGKDQVIAGDITMAQMWSTTAQLAIDARPSIRFALPREGFPLACDNLVILRESRREELALEFLDYLLRPDVAARNATAVRSTTPNAGALALLAPAIRASPVLYPSPEELARGQWFEALPPDGQKLRDRIWTEIKSA